MTVNKRTVLGMAIVVVGLLLSNKTSHASYNYYPPKPQPLPPVPKTPTKIKVSIFDAIKNASDKYGVPLNISLGVAKVESNFSPTAVSRKGAGGLFQLMPGTASGYGVTDVFDPIQNANAGNKFLAAMYVKYGNWNDALAAYNWGPGNFDKYRLGLKEIPSSVAVYIGKVLDASDQYV
jgi:soluble lytic murein transglycosylase-like protein